MLPFALWDEAQAWVMICCRLPSIVNNMGRKKRWAEDMQARFPSGTFARIEAVLRDREDRTDFIREAVERD
jgi:hypothetical protein